MNKHYRCTRGHEWESEMVPFPPPLNWGTDLNLSDFIETGYVFDGPLNVAFGSNVLKALCPVCIYEALKDLLQGHGLEIGRCEEVEGNDVA